MIQNYAVYLRPYWDFDDPAGSEIRFRALLATESDPSSRLEIEAEIARSLGLRGRFAEAFEILDGMKPRLDTARERARMTYDLEYGRAMNSSGDAVGAKAYFDRAAEGEESDLKIDALHMLAIVSDSDTAIAFNERALDLARRSENPAAKAWQGSLLNNLAWAHQVAGRFETALGFFNLALDFRVSQGGDKEIRVARWCVARCLRSLQRFDEAIAIQTELCGDLDVGFASEEMGELLLATGRVGDARPYFSTAAARFVASGALGSGQQARLDRIRSLAADAAHP